MSEFGSLDIWDGQAFCGTDGGYSPDDIDVSLEETGSCLED